MIYAYEDTHPNTGLLNVATRPCHARTAVAHISVPPRQPPYRSCWKIRHAQDVTVYTATWTPMLRINGTRPKASGSAQKRRPSALGGIRGARVRSSTREPVRWIPRSGRKQSGGGEDGAYFSRAGARQGQPDKPPHSVWTAKIDLSARPSPAYHLSNGLGCAGAGADLPKPCRADAWARIRRATWDYKAGSLFAAGLS
jgi:hypothetical protein